MLTVDDIEKISGVVSDKVIASTYNKILHSSGYSDIQDLSMNLILDGYDVSQLVVKLMYHFNKQPSNKISDVQKSKISEIVAETDFKMIQGGDEELNLLHTLSTISTIVGKK